MNSKSLSFIVRRSSLIVRCSWLSASTFRASAFSVQRLTASALAVVTAAVLTACSVPVGGDGGEPASDGGGLAPGSDAAPGSDSGGGSGDAGPGESASFWRLEQPADSERTWFISPEGERVFVLAVNTVMRDSKRGGQSRCEGIDDYIHRHPPTMAAQIEWARLSDGDVNGMTVDKPYHFNAVGAFSDTNDFDDTGGRSYMMRALDDGGAGAPYSIVMSPGPRDESYMLRDAGGTILETGITGARVGDPYNPAFHADLDQRFAERVAPYADDPRLQMWFMGNEAGLFDKGGKGRDGVRDLRRWIWSSCPAASTIDEPQCAPHAAAAFLEDRYGNIGALNAAWESTYASFADIVDGGPRPVPYVTDCNLACREDLQRFVHDGLLREWIYQVTTRMRAADPNHLISSPRLALGSSSGFRFFNGNGAGPGVWFDSGNQVGQNRDDIRYSPYDLFARDGDAGFDLISVNVYTGSANYERPWFTDGIHKLQEESGLPVYISEFSVRARLPNWSNRGGAGAFVPAGDGISDQLQRGQRYRSQIQQFVSFRHIVGAAWHAWSDRYMPADTSLQINMGLVQCQAPGHEAGRRWDRIDDEMRDTNERILEYIEEATGL